MKKGQGRRIKQAGGINKHLCCLCFVRKGKERGGGGGEGEVFHCQTAQEGRLLLGSVCLFVFSGG